MKNLVLFLIMYMICIELFAGYDGVISLSRSSLTTRKSGIYDIVELPGYGNSKVIGAPMLAPRLHKFPFPMTQYYKMTNPKKS